MLGSLSLTKSMHRLLEFIRRIYVFVIFLLFEGIALYTYASSSPYTEAKILARTTATGAAISGAVTDVWHFFSLTSENRRLTERIAELTTELTALGGLELSASMVDSLNSNFKYHPAHVVSMTTNRMDNNIIINRGALDGIAKDMGVITPSNELVGYVASCTDHYAVVQSLLNVNFRTGGKLVGSGNVCFISWDAQSKYQVNANDLSVYSEPEVGMAVEVQSERLPEGVLIGYIDDFHINTAQTAYSATINIAAKMGALENVLVVENTRRNEIEELLEQTGK